MGPGESATRHDIEIAGSLGRYLAKQGYALLTGGRNCGVMEAAMQGAKTENGLTVGVIPGNDPNEMSSSVDIPVFTGMGNARNVINVLSSKLIICIGEGPGTFSEASLAIKMQKPLLWLNWREETRDAFGRLAGENVFFADSRNENEVRKLIKGMLGHT